MSQYAISVRREDGTLALILRIVRSPSGIYVVFAAGQHRPRHDPHSSWHRDGRLHHKSFGREFSRHAKQALTDAFTGTEPFVITSVTAEAAPGFPNCDPADFDGVFEFPASSLGAAPNGTQIHVELLGRGAEPAAVVFQHRLLGRMSFNDRLPTIVVSFYHLS